MNDSFKGYIELSNLNEENIVIEEAKKFQNSIFGAVYEKAQILLGNIIEENRKIRKIEDQRCCKKIDAEHLVGINNVISFEGRRGTGKTSAMLSFRESLMEYEENSFWKSQHENKDVGFFVIDYIDASKLEQGEQLLEIVLANMFSKLREKDRMRQAQEYGRYQNSELYRLFDDVYGSLLSIKESKRMYQEESPLRALTQLSNSQILQKNIKKLVKYYLKYMNMEDCTYGEKRESYLVITIDDLDMHFQEKGSSPFDMLETLHRYLMIPGVVILLSYNAEELYLGCEKHFADIYHSKYDKLEENIKNQIEHIQRLTKEYLKKVLPIHTRVHMVSWKKRDYDEDRIIKIRLMEDETKNYLAKMAPYIKKENDGSVLLTPKEFLFFLKAENTGIYYDAVGKKRHYAEVIGFRELTQIFSFYRQLGNMENENYKYKELLDELYFRFTQEHLLTADKKLFAKYLEVPIERRSKDILETIRENFEKSKNGTDGELSQIEYAKDAARSYSYGELLYGLYEASKNGWFKKELVWCILDSYTIMLTKYYEKIKTSGQTADDLKNVKQKMEDVIGASIASSWSNLLLPKYEKNKSWQQMAERSMSEMSKTVETDFLEGLESGENCAQVTDESLVLLDGQGDGGKYTQYGLGAVKICQTNENKIFWTIKLVESAQKEDLKKQLQQIEILRMFFSDVYHVDDQTKTKTLGFDIVYTPGKLGEQAQGTEESNEEPKFVMKYTDACFNVFNFVHNLFKGKEFFCLIHGEIREEYEKYFQDLKRKQGEAARWMEKETVESFIENNSLYKEYEKWFDETKGFAMPIYSFDMMYNLFKRQYKSSGTQKAVRNLEDIWANIQKAYKGIGKRLKEEDEFYFPEVDENEDRYVTFYQKYNKCPYIDYVNKNGQELTSLISDMLQKILLAVENED